VDANKVELPVGIARVHDDAPVLAVPDDQLAVPFGVLRRQGVVQGSLAGNQETEGVLAGGFVWNISSRDLGAGFGLAFR
jgi:hypothetical protein